MSVRTIVGGELLLDNLDVTTINGSTYPPVSTAGDLTAVLLTGSSAGSTDINMNSNDILAVNNINLITVNGLAYPPVTTPVVPTLSQVLAAGSSAGLTSINMSSQNITSVNNIALTTINGLAYPIPSVAGTQITVTNPSSINILATTTVNVANISLGIGTFIVDILFCLQTKNGFTLVSDLVNIQSSPSGGTVYWSVASPNAVTTTTTTTNNVRGWSFPIKTTSAQTLYLTYYLNYTVSVAQTPIILATPSGQYILKSTQIA